MRKGYYFKYLEAKITDYYQLAKNAESQEEADIYQEQAALYELLFLDKMASRGTVEYCSVSIKESLEGYNKVNNCFLYPSSITKLVTSSALSFVSEEKINLKPFEKTIEYKEATTIVGSFIKEVFGTEAYKVFKDKFIKDKSHILLSNVEGNGRVTKTRDEIFVSLPNNHDIALVGQMAHEAGHFRKMILNPVSYNCLLEEFESFSYEIRLMLWMIHEGIYVNDAINYLLTVMNLLEKSIITRYYNNKYKLWKIKDSRVFEKRVEELDLLALIGLDNNQSLFDYIADTLLHDYPMYLYSFICVVNELDNEEFLKTYNDIIQNVGKVSSKVLVRQNNLDPANINNYMNLRRDLISKQSNNKIIY